MLILPILQFHGVNVFLKMDIFLFLKCPELQNIFNPGKHIFFGFSFLLDIPRQL